MADEQSPGYRYVRPETTGDGWATASLSDVGIDESRVRECVEQILSGGYAEVHSLLIVRDGLLVLDEYFAGHNRAWALIEYDRDRIHDLASATKSVTSIMTGIAVGNRLIEDVHVPALSYFPEYQNMVTPRKSRITIEHLLTMTSGWEWSESTVSDSTNDMFLFNTVPDPLGFLVGKEMVAEPGTVYCYNGGAVTLLGKIIERASGLDLEAFSDAYLFSPMGIEDFEWPYINSDLIAAHGDLDLRPRDMAKLGQMMLRGGVWNDRRILPSHWVEASWHRAGAFPQPSADLGYGYLWWLRSYSAGDASFDAFSARGWGGQRIIVLPGLDTVVVFTGGNYHSPVPVEDIMERHILPAIAP